MPIVLVLEDDESFSEIELDVEEIQNLSNDSETINHEWCIDGSYYTIFYTSREDASCMYNFPPPLGMITYTRVIVTSSNNSIVYNPTPKDMDINDLTATHWYEVESEISGIDSSDSNEEYAPVINDDTYENFYDEKYDSDVEMSEEDYV